MKIRFYYKIDKKSIFLLQNSKYGNMRIRLKAKRTTLKVKTVNKMKVIESYEFYNYIGLCLKNYARWMRETAFNVGENGIDYFPAPYNVECKNMGDRKTDMLRYYFSIDFAISLCRFARRAESMQLIEFLREQNESTQKAERK